MPHSDVDDVVAEVGAIDDAVTDDDIVMLSFCHTRTLNTCRTSVSQAEAVVLVRCDESLDVYDLTLLLRADAKAILLVNSSKINKWFI
jgi:hypothetical protein